MFCGFTRSRYQVSVYRTIGPLVSSPERKAHKVSLKFTCRAGVRPSVSVSVNTFKHEYL